LGELGISPRTGFVYDGVHRATLSAEDLGSFQTQPSILYLHGAVGWYRGPDGSIVSYPANDPYRPDLGRPAVLYPSKNKVVEESTVREIWLQLDEAIKHATHVFVLGHGLADEHLVARLRAVNAPLAVTVHTDRDRENAATLLPKAELFDMEFSPEPTYDAPALHAWASKGELVSA
jgi:hypothetical protein